MIDRYRRIKQEVRDTQDGSDEGGFTLIELLIVIVVIGILAAVTVFGLSNVTGQSLTSACHADAKSVAVAAEAFHAADPQQQWPTNVGVLTGTDPNNRYLRTLPGNTNKYVITTSGGNVFVATAATPGGLTGAGVNFENPGAGVADPCNGL